jgi:hypothetical protein
MAQRNMQSSDCLVPLTNATTSDGYASLTINVPLDGPTPSLTPGENDFHVTFDDPTQAIFTLWNSTTAGEGTDYKLSQSDDKTKTTVRLGKPSITFKDSLAIEIAPGHTVNAKASVNPVSGDQKLQVGATLNDLTGHELVANGVTCSGSAPTNPGSGGAGGGGGSPGAGGGSGEIL